MSTTIDPDPATPTLYVCWIPFGGKVHPCTKADAALNAAGVEHERVVYGPGRPFGVGTTGRRPDLQAVSGQEKLPVLVLPGGETISGSGPIVDWAEAQGNA